MCLGGVRGEIEVKWGVCKVDVKRRVCAWACLCVGV